MNYDIPLAMILGMMTGYVLAPVPYRLLKLLEQSSLFKIIVLTLGVALLRGGQGQKPTAYKEHLSLWIPGLCWAIILVGFLEMWRENDAENVALQPDSMLKKDD